MLAKPKDAVYVNMAADIGITEGCYPGTWQDLRTGRSGGRIPSIGSSCTRREGIKKLEEIPEYSRVATSYPNITREFFQQKGIQVEIIHLYGSVELAPLVDLADLIVDITSTGTTLRKNRLIPIATITESTSRLIVNSVSYKTRYDFINGLMARLKK